MQIVAVKCSITEKYFSVSDCELLPFYSSHSFPIVAWGMCTVLAWCHGGTTNRRYNTSKSICQVRDRSKALQGMTAGCTYRPHKTFCLFLSVSLWFASAPACPRFSPLYLCFRAQPQALKSHFNNSTRHAWHLTVWNVLMWLTYVKWHVESHCMPFCIMMIFCWMWIPDIEKKCFTAYKMLKT